MMATYSVVYFWLEVVLQFVIGIAGFIANMVVIPILCWYEHLITAWYHLVSSLKAVEHLRHPI